MPSSQSIVRSLLLVAGRYGVLTPFGQQAEPSPQPSGVQPNGTATRTVWLRAMAWYLGQFPLPLYQHPPFGAVQCTVTGCHPSSRQGPWKQRIGRKKSTSTGAVFLWPCDTGSPAGFRPVTAPCSTPVFPSLPFCAEAAPLFLCLERAPIMGARHLSAVLCHRPAATRCAAAKKIFPAGGGGKGDLAGIGSPLDPFHPPISQFQCWQANRWATGSRRFLLSDKELGR